MFKSICLRSFIPNPCLPYNVLRQSTLKVKASSSESAPASEADLYMTKILESSDRELKQDGRSATGSSELITQKLQERMEDVGGEVETP